MLMNASLELMIAMIAHVLNVLIPRVASDVNVNQAIGEMEHHATFLVRKMVQK